MLAALLLGFAPFETAAAQNADSSCFGLVIHGGAGSITPEDMGEVDLPTRERSVRKYRTVGAAARDREGNLAAGASTGGISFKRWGRVGDSPIIGAGTYADNATCAISATGDGGHFIRGVIAPDIAAMGYADLSLEEAADAVIQEKLPELGGRGAIGIDADGHIAVTGA